MAIIIKHGEMALAYALRLLEQDKTVNLTNYGSYLAQFPPEYECEIVDNTSWSCAHGVERWRSNCGCNGGKPGWNQLWREPLRQALDELRDAVAPLTEQEGGKLFKDVWAARDAYIEVMLDRSTEAVDRFLAASSEPRAHRSRSACARCELMEMQRHTQLMYTSCGWFFDDISGIETVQIIAYAARVLQLAKELFGEQAANAGAAFLARLAEARSNVPAQATARASTRRRSPPWSWAWSRWRRTTPSAPSSRRLPKRLTCSAIAFAASRTKSTPRAEGGWRWAGRTSPAPSPARQQSFHLRCCTSATRTLRPP